MSVRPMDTALIARDRRLKGLATVLDSTMLNRQLAKLDGRPIKVPRQHYVRYKPGTNCLVSYRDDADVGTPNIYAKAYVDEFDEKFAKDKRRVACGWAPPERLWALPEQRVLVRKFPLDGRLRSLKVLADPETQSNFVRRLFPNQANTHNTNIQTLAYKPERRYVAKLTGIEAGDSVLKFYRSKSFKRSLKNLRYLQGTGLDLLPELIGKSDRRQVLALGWRTGEIFREQLAGSSSSQESVAAIGTALAALHRQPPSSRLLKWNLQHELARLQELTDTLAILVPGCAIRTQQVCDGISRQLAFAPMSQHVIHGDFHSKQILVNGGSVRFLDPDEIAVGPAQLDVGTFIAHLYRDGLGGKIPFAAIGQTVDAFLDAYQTAEGPTESVTVYTALALLKFSHHPFRACENNWDERIERIVNLAWQFTSYRSISEHRVSSL